MNARKNIRLIQLSLLSFCFSLTNPVWAGATEWGNLIADGEKFYKSRNFAEAETIFRSALKECESSGLDDGKLGITLNNLALVLESQNKDAEAEAVYKRALEVKEKGVGADSISLVPSLNNLAKLYFKEKKFELAKQQYERALAIAEKDKGKSENVLIPILNSLGHVAKILGDATGASKYVERVAELTAKTGNVDAQTVTLNNQAVQLRHEKKYAEAEVLYKKVIELREKQQGGDHLNVVAAMNNLAGMYREWEKPELAQQLLERALKTAETIGNDQAISTCLHNLCKNLREQGEFEACLPYSKRLLEIREKRAEEDPRAYLEALTDRALSLDSLDKYDEAKPLLEKSVTIAEKLEGDKSLLYATAMNNLKEIYLHMEDFSGAEALMKRVIVVRKGVLGDTNPEIGKDMNDLALIYKQQGKGNDAEPSFKEAVAIDEKGGSESLPELATSLNNLARLYRDEGKYTEAEPLYKRSLALREELYGKEDIKVAASLRNYAALLRDMGRKDEAAALDTRARAIESKE
ncbi:MAG: hypothetical protein C0507_23420 [Cyanobacteria bacterium PR.3.49]|jgi:tetratricopeptide (TPR) repeat protein|nr:hypothetical protein [Cyanobacteria bacterium PR.3.49]